MDTVKTFIYILFYAVFIVALFISLKFQFGSEGKDERGQQINNYAYMTAFPLFPIGWLLTQLYDDFVQPIEPDVYKGIMAALIAGAYIIHALTITILKRKR